MAAKDWRAEERELEELTRASAEPVLVFLGEPFHPGAQVMAERLRHLGSKLVGVRYLELTLGTYRLWAHAHAVFGTPTLLVFRRGRITARLQGLLEVEELERALREALQ